MEKQTRAVEAHTSGIEGTTRYKVVGGVPGGRPIERPASLEFAVAPIEGGAPAYHKAIVLKSDSEGRYSVVLPPGTYWLGPKAKALDPINYRPVAITVSERVAVVREGTFTEIDLSAVGHAP